jgi:hypothetical protein
MTSLSAAASRGGSSKSLAVSGLSADTRGQLDHTGPLGRGAAGRHWPQSTQIVVPFAGLAAGQRIAGMLAPSPPRHRTCSVSREQPLQ